MLWLVNDVRLITDASGLSNQMGSATNVLARNSEPRSGARSK